MPRKSYKIQEALQKRKQNEAAALDNLRVEETAYQCYFQPDSLPSPMESGVICILPLAKLSVYPNHETYFPLYTGERLDDMVESIRRYGVQTPILVWKTANKRHIIISGHNRVNASLLAGLSSIPAVVRTDLTKEGAEDLFFEMNFRQRSLADMLFSQRVLCIAAHYNLIKRQGRRSDILGPRRTSPDTQEKSLANQLLTSPETQEKFQADAQVAQEYELTRDKVSKYCRYATLYRPLLQLMDQGKKLGQLAAYEISFIEDQSLQTMMALDGGKYGKAILDSCRIKFIMQMEEQEARLAQNVLNLTEEEVRMITRFHRGEGLLCIGHNHVPIAVHVSPKEYSAITTSPTDRRAQLTNQV